jgi:hypothetical protein
VSGRLIPDFEEFCAIAAKLDNTAPMIMSVRVIFFMTSLFGFFYWFDLLIFILKKITTLFVLLSGFLNIAFIYYLVKVNTFLFKVLY